jgi:hypothetical protein
VTDPPKRCAGSTSCRGSRNDVPWHRFTTLALAALAVLVICAADAAKHDPADTELIKLTLNEVRRLINTGIIRLAHRLRWSQRRRRHQARARRCHYTRRLNLELEL